MKKIYLLLILLVLVMAALTSFLFYRAYTNDNYFEREDSIKTGAKENMPAVTALP